jgi:chemotaxis protein MotB
MKHSFLFIVSSIVLFSVCSTSNAWAVSKKKKLSELESQYNALQAENSACHDSLAAYTSSNRLLKEQLSDKESQLKDEKETNERVLNHLKDLSVISGSQAESINKFLASMGAKDAYIQNLQSVISRKDSITMALVLSLKSAIGNMDDKDINIKIEKGVIYVDISDKMLFKTGKYEVTPSAKEVLGKVAKVLLSHPEIEFMVEGHTDNVPFKEGVLLDNWDLSVKRATSVVRILQNEYNIPPAHMTAAGRSEYLPVGGNDTEEGRAANRRTRIVILPDLDQFFNLLEKSNK